MGLRTDTELQSVCTRQEFDSQKDLFSVYARDEAALRTFIRGFREACEDAGQRTDRVVAER